MITNMANSLYYFFAQGVKGSLARPAKPECNVNPRTWDLHFKRRCEPSVFAMPMPTLPGRFTVNHLWQGNPKDTRPQLEGSSMSLLPAPYPLSPKPRELSNRLWQTDLCSS